MAWHARLGLQLPRKLRVTEIRFRTFGMTGIDSQFRGNVYDVVGNLDRLHIAAVLRAEGPLRILQSVAGNGDDDRLARRNLTSSVLLDQACPAGARAGLR